MSDPAVPDPSRAASALPPIERLIAGNLVAEIVPAIGGSIAAFYADEPSGRRDWLRPADEEALRAGDPLGMASFPLVPWCNRIRDGHFTWEGRGIQLPPNADGTRHSIHGIGWRRPWQVTAQGASSIELRLIETGEGAWPFAFEATERYALDATALQVELSVHNSGSRPMPVGLGHHPYLPHRRAAAGTTVKAEVRAMWLSDAEVMPTTLSSSDPAVEALNRGMPLAQFVLDNNFTGFGHHARVTWPDGSGLVLASEPPLDYFVLYSPSDQDVFVIEAVSNCTDWLNLRHHTPAAELGGAVLDPGATLTMLTRFVPSRA